MILAQAVLGAEGGGDSLRAGSMPSSYGSAAFGTSPPQARQLPAAPRLPRCAL